MKPTEKRNEDVNVLQIKKKEKSKNKYQKNQPKIRFVSFLVFLRLFEFNSGILGLLFKHFYFKILLIINYQLKHVF